LIGGQATVLYGAATFSEDIDFGFIRELPQGLEIMPSVISSFSSGSCANTGSISRRIFLVQPGQTSCLG